MFEVKKPEQPIKKDMKAMANELLMSPLLTNKVSRAIASVPEKEADEMIDTIAAWNGTVIDRDALIKEGEIFRILEDILHRVAGHAETMDDYDERANERKDKKAEILEYLKGRLHELESAIAVVEAQKD